MKHIGIYSGSFDPVHEGHISFAKEAMMACNLERVVFMPERFPRGKPNVSPISERVTELEFALAETPFEVLNAEADQFTVDETLTELEVLYPDTAFTFLVGSDVAVRIVEWPNSERLIAQYDFVVGLRANDTEDDIVKSFHGLPLRATFVKTQHSDISSQNLRLHRQQGLSENNHS